MKKVILLFLLACLTIASHAQMVTDQGIMGPMHQKYLNKIVFMKEFVGKDDMKESDLLTNTTPYAPLQLRFYLEHSLTNLALTKFPSTPVDQIHKDPSMKLVWYVDGQKASDSYSFNNYLDASELDSYTTVVYPIFEMDRGKLQSNPVWDHFLLDAGHLLKKGSHKLKLELYFIPNASGTSEIGPLASGEITLDLATDLINPADPRVCLPKALKKDPALEAKMIEVFKAQGWNETPQRAIIESEWEVVYHSVSGKITGRKFFGSVSSTLDGKCRYQQFKFFQQGPGGSYGGPLTIIEVGVQPDIHCDCMK